MAKAISYTARKQLHAHIVEDHDNALEHILRNIGAKTLQFSDNILLHFDSHPDLLTDAVYANDVREKDLLVTKVSIETWIVPLLYAEHFNVVIWIKPLWSTQIHVHDSTLYVGEHKETGQLRVFSELPYFVGSGSCSTLEQLKNVKPISLTVACLQANDSMSKIFRLIQERNGNYVLDIDLDYYSTKNPFLDMCSKINMYEKLKSIYNFDLSHINDIADTITRRERQIKSLETIFQYLSDPMHTLEGFDNILLDTSLDADTVQKVKELVTEFLEQFDDVDWMLVHDAGTTIDDPKYELPHHISTIDEINEYFIETKIFLDTLPQPKLVTIARSTLDDYCPSNQVDYIQKTLTDYLEKRFNARIYLDY